MSLGTMISRVQAEFTDDVIERIAHTVGYAMDSTSRMDIP
jgi:hypothetical protein